MIHDVIISPISTYEDERGWLKEIYRLDEHHFQVAMSYVSWTKYRTVRGPHEHVYQTDFFVFIGPGDFKLYLWDNRKDSPTYQEKMMVIAGESHPISVKVPPGVVHGYKSISPSGSFSINLPDTLYKGRNKQEEVDEIRHEQDPHFPFQIL
jgi:dTDP-4-dehydrorhamnose 3,5-epimerase